MDRLIKVGKIEPKSSKNVRTSRLGIGFEKLDRDIFDPEKAYDKVADLGVKWVRLQSGWQKTERQKGVYDFAWLDKIVDNLIARGLVPWMCLCYGNDLYNEKAKEIFGAVGCPPIFTEEERKAWDSYVRAIVKHFQGRVFDYEVWNEPDGAWCWKHGVNATEYGVFARDTAKAVKETDPSINVYAGAHCMPSISFINQALSTGMGEYLDAVTYHAYDTDERRSTYVASAVRALARRYNSKIDVIQGETGAPSKTEGFGALWYCAWNERKQAKQLLRHCVSDLWAGVKFTSHFSCIDMVEALNGKEGDVASYKDYGYFGLLAAEFDDEGRSTGEYSPKPSYYAMQSIASIFANEFETCEMPIFVFPKDSPRLYREKEAYAWDIRSGGFCRKNGSFAYAYWSPASLMTTDYESTISMECSALPEDIRLIDTYDGSVYKIPESIMTKDEFGTVTLKNLPIKDYPLILTFGDFVE